MVLDHAPLVVFEDEQVGGNQDALAEAFVARHESGLAQHVGLGVLALNLGDTPTRQDVPPTLDDGGATAQDVGARMHTSDGRPHGPRGFHGRQVPNSECSIEGVVRGQ